MENQEVKKIIALLEKSFDGSAWHGPSLMSILNDVSYEKAFEQNHNIHSIAELVAHSTTWKKFAIERVKGHNTFDITEQLNWSSFPKKDAATWSEVLEELKSTQDELTTVLETISDLKLTDIVEDKAYNFYTLLHGVIQHDIYHGGQIALLKKL